MYTSKHTSLSPNQFMRPQRDHSPSHKHQSKGSKFYSSEEVSRMIKSYIQPKIHFLRNELQQKQKIIQVLNQKLDQNDQLIHKMYSYAENMARRIKQPQQNTHLVPVINQILNDKLKEYWQIVNGHIEQVKEAFQQGSLIDSKKMEAKIQMELENIKKYATEYVEGSRVKNNNYWLKIKEALNRINSKIMKVDEALQKTNENLENFRHQSQYAYEHINELQKSKGVIKKLIQLKKSVNNIYQNYESVLELQDQYKNRLTQSNLRNRMPNEGSNDLIDFNEVRENQHSQQGGNTFPMFRKKPVNFIDQVKHSDTQNQYFQPSYKKNNFHEKDSYQFPDQNFALEYSKEQNPSDIFHAPMTSKVATAKDTQKNMFSTKYYVPNVSSTHKKSMNTFLLGQSPVKNPSQGGKWEPGMSSPNELSCLNSSSNALRHGASRSTSFVNLSLENRNQMSESVRQRLQEIIELKNLNKPLLVYLDEINYLKNNEGNYIFDTRGNMFKVSFDEGKQLERLGLIRFIQKGNGRDQSSGNKNSLAFGSASHNEQALSRGKTINISNSKVKSISIKQTAI